MMPSISFRTVLLNFTLYSTLFCQSATIPLYRLFEREITNNKVYSNNFKDVTLNVQYQAPSGRIYDFFGFYDGDGKGNSGGNIWKIRFIPDEPGEWTYVYDWSDGTKGGK
ncbi:DUF5060 domain-containing protein, partial [candidate division KSB1 bacterium]|nr:DUF5060 domain-containing protein [candidate division KSB1 bacterium]